MFVPDETSDSPVNRWAAGLQRTQGTHVVQLAHGVPGNAGSFGSPEYGNSNMPVIVVQSGVEHTLVTTPDRHETRHGKNYHDVGTNGKDSAHHGKFTSTTGEPLSAQVAKAHPKAQMNTYTRKAALDEGFATAGETAELALGLRNAVPMAYRRAYVIQLLLIFPMPSETAN